jgi:hypothetical protein
MRHCEVTEAVRFLVNTAIDMERWYRNRNNVVHVARDVCTTCQDTLVVKNRKPLVMRRRAMKVDCSCASQLALYLSVMCVFFGTSVFAREAARSVLCTAYNVVSLCHQP